ncbi:STAS domain-containing protein [Gillisia sp. Hel1_33_143]|uniref:STAS domain-containing protein n=1 Tax=Gillisia sp. Hel1_33_143 TaxID=1336796 RepID=UPI000879ECB4|nr:STAS domain-containing protein [Gillisia sp. Hel1_33_143]SDS18907.1 STAS domain-containing protein [Gillisia sp. Hel1_33_143]
MTRKEVDGTINLSGKLTSGNVSEIEICLQEALTETADLVINLNDLISIDVSGYFMLFIFKKNAVLANKKVTYLISNTPIITGSINGINPPKLAL